MAQSDYDAIPYNRAITRFGIQIGAQGTSFADKMAPPTPVAEQGFVVPKFTSADEGKGKTNDTIGPDGRPNVRESAKFTLVPGFANRRGLRGVIRKELTKGPFANFYASVKSETAQNVNSLRYRMEKKVRTLVETAQGVSGHNASPSTKWDAASYAADIIADAEAAVDAAEANANSDMLSGGGWEWYTNRSVARVIGAWMREKLKYTDAAFIRGGKIPLELAGLPLNVAGIVENTAHAGQTPTYARVWSADDIYLVYTNPSFASSQNTFTAMAQMQWTGLTAPYGTKVFEHPEDDVYQTIVSTDVYDELVLLSISGVYALKHVLTTEVA